MKHIKWGIIGCGDVTEKKSGPAFQKIEGSSLHMVMRRNEKKLIDYAARHGVKNYSTDYLDLLKNDDINAIYIATPPHMHCFYTLQAAKYKKAVYVEKPMAVTVSECRLMIDACKENDVPLYVAYYRRGQDKFKYAKQIVNDGVIGAIRSFNYLYTSKIPRYNAERSWLMKKDKAGGGLLYDIGSHMMNIILYLFGETEFITGIAANQKKSFDVNDVVSGILRFKNDIQGSVQLSFNANEKHDELIIIGDKGTMKFAIMANSPIIIIKDGVKKSIPFDDIEHVQMPFIRLVVGSLQGKSSLDTTGIYGLRTQEVLETLSKG